MSRIDLLRRVPGDGNRLGRGLGIVAGLPGAAQRRTAPANHCAIRCHASSTDAGAGCEYSGSKASCARTGIRISSAATNVVSKRVIVLLMLASSHEKGRLRITHRC